MLKSLPFASLLLVTTCLMAPAAMAQSTAPGTAGSSGITPPASEPAAQEQAPADVSIPGGGDDIVVVGRSRANPVQTAPQVISVLSAQDIARTGEGDIAGALQRVTGLSVVGSGFVYVRGLGDRYSLALLNGSPLPSPEPLRRVVPLDLFPTDVIASALVQKSYSVNFPGEFGGGVINLTTRSTPDEPFLTISGGVGGNTETTGQLGYQYYGSPLDWTGFDNGTRDVPGPLQAAFDSGNPILEGANFSAADLQGIASSLVNSRTSLLQTTRQLPVNFSGNLTGGTSVDVGDVRLGIIATAGLDNSLRVRQTLQQLSLNADLSGTPQTSFDRVITDNRVVVNGLLGINAEFGENVIRWTNLYIRDTIKQTRLGQGTDENQAGRDILDQDTAWYERQLIDTQIVGEFDFGDFDLDARGGYAKSQREAPYERSFTYVRTNQVGDPTGNKFVNDLGGNKGDATIAFSDLNEDLYSAGIDGIYSMGDFKLGVGYAFTDTQRTSVRRAFQFRASNLPVPVQQLRPDYLLSDSAIQYYNILLQETSASDGNAAFDALLRTHAGYGQLVAQLTPALNVTGGVRYETAKQTVNAVDLFGTGAATQFNTNLNNDYWLPAITVTYELAPQMQLRASASRTIARPQFRELISQVYIDTDTNRTFRGNPSLVDSRLTNAEGRFEWFYARDQRITAAGFYKKIDRPIEAFSSILSSEATQSFTNAPEATLWGVELEAQKYIPLDGMFDGDFFAKRRVALIGNYTYTQSKLKVSADDTTVINGVVLPSSNFFRDGSPLTGQSDHLVNLQIGLEDTGALSQQTILLSYASDRVTTRGPSGQPDVKERPGFRVDFVAREAVDLFGLDTEVKFEARNITATKYQEFQEFEDRRIYYNLYDLGASVSVGLGVKF